MATIVFFVYCVIFYLNNIGSTYLCQSLLDCCPLAGVWPQGAGEPSSEEAQAHQRPQPGSPEQTPSAQQETLSAQESLSRQETPCGR